MTLLVEMLSAARHVGLVMVSRPDGKLVIRGPRSVEPLVRALLARKADVLRALPVYDGTATRLDWRRGRLLDEPAPCALCGRSTLLVEPYDGQPCHKSCAEAAIRWGSVGAAQPDGGGGMTVTVRTYTTTRPRGFAPWVPRAASIELLGLVLGVLRRVDGVA